MNKLIELKNLTKNFDDQQVLRGINLDIYEKEFLTLLGPSGCGKTTTLLPAQLSNHSFSLFPDCLFI